jgi:hypothetical protein
MLDPETLKRFQEMVDQSKDERDDGDPLAALGSRLEVAAWVIATARADGFSEVDAVELLLHDADRLTLREHASVLARLGYADVAARLRQMAKPRWRKSGERLSWRERMRQWARRREAMRRPRTYH